MNPKRKRPALAAVLTGMVISVLSTMNAQSQNPAAATQPAATKKAEEVFKNIQVLKGQPADQVIPSMQFISGALGVDCGFCHVNDAFEKDDKEGKKAARDMIKMQFAINQENFRGRAEVTCFTCHRGAHNPVGVPIIADQDASEAPQETSAPAVTADQILDKYVHALGGADAISKISSRTIKATATMGGGNPGFTEELFAKAPDKRTVVMHLPNGESVTTYDGHAAWSSFPGRPVRELTGPDLASAAIEADFYLPLDIKKLFDRLRVARPEKVGDQMATVLIGTRQGQPPVRLEFDPQSGLLLRTVYYAETPLGRIPRQIDYSDYREQDGVKLPFAWTASQPQRRLAVKVSEIKQNTQIDDTKFAKPAENAAPEQRPSPSK